MNRRNVLVGLGVIVVMSGVLLGTGAFSSVEADRSVSVDVADDSNALIGIEPGDNTQLVSNDSGTVEIDASDSALGENASGVNRNATLSIDEGLKITNNYGDEVNVTIDSSELSNNINISFLNDGSEFEYEIINPGDTIQLDIMIDTHDIGEDENLDDTITISAEPTGN